MTKRERVLAALNHQPTDRVPFSVYTHSSIHDRSVDRFVEFTLAFQKKYDPDYVKVMFDDHYDLPGPFEFVRSLEVWNELEEHDPHLGAFGRQLEALRRIKQAVGPEVPVVQTIYLPFHYGLRLAYTRILDDLTADRELVLRGLAVIAANTRRFARACLDEAGIDGFFFGAYGCAGAWLSRSEYRLHALPLDLAVLEPLRTAPVTILHIHGERDAYFDLLKDYPVRALSWEDRTAGPTLAEARALTDKCLVGGIDHILARTSQPDALVAQGQEAIRDCGGRGLILAPGCTLTGAVPEKNIQAVARAARSGNPTG